MTKKRLLAPMFGLRRITGYTEVTLFAELLRAFLRNEIAVTRHRGSHVIKMSDEYPVRQRAYHAARLRLLGDRAVGMVRGAILPFARLTNPP
jgi:hypothetical protein